MLHMNDINLTDRIVHVDGGRFIGSCQNTYSCKLYANIILVKET